MRVLLGALFALLTFSVTQGTTQCPTGIEQLQCCQQTTTRLANPSLDALLTVLGLPQSSVGPDVPVGVTCSPVTVKNQFQELRHTFGTEMYLLL